MDTNKMFIDMARQAREFAEMCDRVANESNAVKEDPEAWRERNRQRQAAGVKFEWRNEGIWRRGYKGSIFTFDIGGEEDYREVPQPIPHAAERALPKPTKLTAKIICKANIAYQSFAQDWEFYGTPEEYVAQCEKYGYVVVSEIKEAVEKPEMVKYYFALIKNKNDCISTWLYTDKDALASDAEMFKVNIIGNIEEREVPIMDVINLKGIVWVGTGMKPRVI